MTEAVLLWHCNGCGWTTAMEMPGFPGDGTYHYDYDGENEGKCGPMVARTARKVDFGPLLDAFEPADD